MASHQPAPDPLKDARKTIERALDALYAEREALNARIEEAEGALASLSGNNNTKKSRKRTWRPLSEQRLRELEQHVRSRDKPFTAAEIAPEFALNPNSIGWGLRQLRDKGVLTEAGRRDRHILYIAA